MSSSTSVLVIGKSGRGKSTALRNLPLETTYIINVMGKTLPFPNGAKYELGKNLINLSDPVTILSIMDSVSKNKPGINHLVIDDAQYIMATEFMQNAMVKGYDKFTIMAKHFWDILVKANALRAGLKVFILAHEEETPTERKMKTLGKLLDEKLTPEGMSTIVLFSDLMKEDENVYYFQTQSDGATNAKSPMGMFPMYIPNDLWLVSQRIDEYYTGVSLENSKIDFSKIEKGGDKNGRK